MWVKPCFAASAMSATLKCAATAKSGVTRLNVLMGGEVDTNRARRKVSHW
jgi:hypothetical protein